MDLWSVLNDLANGVSEGWRIAKSSESGTPILHHSKINTLNLEKWYHTKFPEGRMSEFLRLLSLNFDDIFPRANKETGWHDKAKNDCHQMEMIMQAEKAILETDQYGRLLQQPDLPPNTRMEAIFLILESKSKNNLKRKPSAKIILLW